MKEEMLENGLLYGLKMPSSYSTLEEESVRTVERGIKDYPKAQELFRMLQSDEETVTLLNLANFIAVRKLGYNDHGGTHARIVTANAIKLLSIIMGSGLVELDCKKHLGMTDDDAYVIVIASCMLHDVGNAVHRKDHEMFSVMYAKMILDRLLPEIYPDVSKRTAIAQQVLHAIFAHDEGGDALTIEATIAVIADGADITKGRGRLAFDMGKHDIHSISALSIDSVDIVKGASKLIEIHVLMSNSAGIYQVQETLVKKVAQGPLREHVEIVAELRPTKLPQEMKVLDRIVFSDGKMASL